MVIYQIVLTPILKEVREVHQHGTRMRDKNKLYECLKYNTKTYGKKMFRIQGPKVLNKLKNLAFYSEAKTKFYFRKKYKKYLIENK